MLRRVIKSGGHPRCSKSINRLLSLFWSFTEPLGHFPRRPKHPRMHLFFKVHPLLKRNLHKIIVLEPLRTWDMKRHAPSAQIISHRTALSFSMANKHYSRLFTLCSLIPFEAWSVNLLWFFLRINRQRHIKVNENASKMALDYLAWNLKEFRLRLKKIFVV